VSVHPREADDIWVPKEKTMYVYSAASYRKGNIGVGIYHEVTSKTGEKFQCQRSLEVGNKAQVPPVEVGLRAIDGADDFVCDCFSPRNVAAFGPRLQAMEYTIVSTNRAAVQAIENTDEHQTRHC